MGSLNKGEMVDRRIRVDVTERDIQKAKRGDSFKCVVMQAIARTIPDATRIDVDSQTIRFTERDARYIYVTPAAVTGYVIAFDAGDPPEAFSFQLRHGRRVQANRRVLTDAGRQVHRAAAKARHKARQSKPTPTAEEMRQAASAAYTEAKKTVGDVPLRQSDRGGRPAPPRVFKSNERHYGYRVMRINRERAQADIAADE